LIEDEPSFNISRHLIAKSIYALFPNSAKEFWRQEDPGTHIAMLNYPMPTIDLLDTFSSKASGPGSSQQFSRLRISYIVLNKLLMPSKESCVRSWDINMGSIPL